MKLLSMACMLLYQQFFNSKYLMSANQLISSRQTLQNHMIKDQHVIFSYHMVENGDGLKNESLLCTVLALYCLLWTNYELYHWCWHRRHHWTGSRSWHGLWFFFTNFLMSYNLMNIMVAKSCLVITSGGCSDVTPLIA